jgi:hypothetical protein
MAGTDKQREEINRKLVTMQMEMIGLSYQDAMDTPEFWRVYTLTTEQTLEWRKVALPLIKKTFKCNKKIAEITMDMFELNLGLREFNPPIVEEEYFWNVDKRFDTTHIRTTIPHEAQLLKNQKPTFWQKITKFFVGYYD